MSKPKSAYSIPGKKQKNDTHIIVVWVDNEAGVLARVVGLFSGRGYNIESLAVAEVDTKLNISAPLVIATAPVLETLIRPCDFKFFAILSISLLRAVI